jgi:hypothetical protein
LVDLHRIKQIPNGTSFLSAEQAVSALSLFSKDGSLVDSGQVEGLLRAAGFNGIAAS